MGWTVLLYWLLLRRLRSSWGLLALSSFGILAAVTLMASGAIYSRALAEGGLRHVLATADPAVLNVQVIAQDRPLGPADYRNLRGNVEELAETRLSSLLRGVHRFGRAQPNLPLITAPSELPPTRDGPVGRPFFLTGFEAHSRIVKGRWPEVATAYSGQTLELEVVIGRRTASSLGLDVGSLAQLVPYRNDPAERITLTVVGVAEPLDAREEYWMNSPAYFSVQDFGGQLLVPFFVQEDAFFRGLGARYPSLVGDFGWFLFLDTSALTANTTGAAIDALAGLETDINKRFPRSLVLTGLKKTLADYQRELKLAKVPIYLFISLVVVVILYFLALVPGLLARARSDEFGLLRSRGASAPQIICLSAMEQGAVVLCAIGVGPFLALGIVRYLFVGTIDPAGDAQAPLSVGIGADMFILGTVGGFLALLALLASSVGRARLGVAESLWSRARPPAMPLLHRYYVDLLVIAAVALVWWQIHGRGGFVARELASRGLEVDPSLILGPVLGLLAAAVLLLRVLPLLVRSVAWLGARLGPAWVAFSLLRLARDPIPHGSLAVILLAAAALGVFGATFQETLSRSQRDQALYAVGGDLVVRGPRMPDSALQEVAAVPGIRAASPVLRDSVSLLGLAPGTFTTLLAVDPEALPAAAWFREDFADQSLEHLLRPLRRDYHVFRGSSDYPGPGIGFPSDADSIGVWLNLDGLDPDTPRYGLSLWARLAGAGGKYRDVSFGDLLDPPSRTAGGSALSSASAGSTESPDKSGSTSGRSSGQGWLYLEAPLDESVQSLEPPIGLVSIYFSKGITVRTPPGRVSLDDITVKGPSTPAAGAIIEGYEEVGDWVALANGGLAPDLAERAKHAARTGNAGLSFSWQEPFADTPRGILIPPGPAPLPAIGGPTFYPGQEIRVKEGKWIVPLVVRGITSYFPTVDPSSQSFLMVSLNDYYNFVRRLPQGTLEPPGEIWAAVEEGADRKQIARSLGERLHTFISVQDRDAALELARRNPLAGGGWDGLTILSMSAITVVVLLALALHAAAAIHTGRVDLTVAQALGFSRLQLTLSLAMERSLVAAIGLLAGSALGFWPGREILKLLDVSSTGQPVIPPLAPAFQEWLLALVLLSLVAASVVALVFAVMAARRLRVPNVLRSVE